MSPTNIACGRCGYSRQMPASVLPQRPAHVTCPKCGNVFLFTPSAAAGMPVPPPVQARPAETRPPKPPQGLTPPPPTPPRRPGSAGFKDSADKRLFLLFLALVAVTVGVRLWADARFKAVPYPNLMAASASGIAVACGNSVYVFGHDGKLLRSHPLPDAAQPTQLFWDNATLCVSDMRSKSILALEGNKAPRIAGAEIMAQFKAIREPATDLLFVTDSARHRVLVFDERGILLRSFGREGREAGEFRFPNEMSFDEAGNLVIANTKLPAVEVYSPEGQYKGTLAKQGGDAYRYPTDLVLLPERLVVMENDGFLERAQVRVYDRKGGSIGELPLGGAKVVGDLAADGDRIYLTDCENRTLSAFSLNDLRPLGSFSREFDGMAAQWERDAAWYRAISTYSLVLLLVLCLPVVVFYLKTKRGEMREVAQVDLGSRVGGGSHAGGSDAGDIVLGVAVRPWLRNLSLLLAAVGFAGPLLAVLAIGAGLPRAAGLAAASCGLLAAVGFILLLRAGALGDWTRKQTEQVLKRIVRDGMLPLAPGEVLRKAAQAPRKTGAATDTDLVVFTDRRLLLYRLSWNRITGIEQYPFQAIAAVHPPVVRFLQATPTLRVVLTVQGRKEERLYHHHQKEFLALLGGEFLSRKGSVSEVCYAKLCLTCRQPMQGGYCLSCATKLAPDRQAMWLSLLFPGLGQLKNGELQKGLSYLVVGVLSLLLGYVGVKGWFFEGADLNPGQKMKLALFVAMTPIWYAANVVDAYKASIRGRKAE